MPFHYSRNESIPLPLPESPSLIPNNLSMRHDGDAIIYIHANEIIYVSTVGKNEHHKVALGNANNKSHVQQASFVRSKSCTYIIIVTSTGVFVWNDDGTHMLFFLALADITIGDVEYQFMRGIASNEHNAFIGTSIGQVLEICLPHDGDDTHIELVSTVSASRHPITCLTANEEMLICADDTGGICGYSTSKRIASAAFTKSGDGYPCTSITATKDTFIAGFSTGHLRGYNLRTGELLVVLTAHIRCINALSLHPNENTLVSVGEDQYLNIWTVGDFSSRIGKSFDLLSSVKLENHLCTGVAIHADGHIYVSSYDEDELLVFHRGL